MMEHLSEQQITEWLIGGREARVSRHLEECVNCGAEIHRLEQTLGAFRTSVHEWSADQSPKLLRRNEISSTARRPFAAWSWVAAMAMALCFFLAYHARLNPPSQIRTTEPTISDAALLREVNQQLSRTVPPPLEPLSTSVSLKATAQ